jgi:hypothetical protein
MIKSLICRSARPDLSTAALTATAPSIGAGTSFNAPPKDPMGVLTADTIKTSVIYYEINTGKYLYDECTNILFR